MARKKKTATNELAVQNAAKTLLANIRFASVDAPVKTIVITSSVQNEGKTTVAYNLAQAVASSGKRTLLVECDMRCRSLAELIGVRARHGIYSVLSGQVDLEGAAVSTPHRNLSLLDSEPHIPSPADILSSRRFQGLLTSMEESYDFVVIDTPPVGTFVDAAIIASFVDAVALVVRERFVKRTELEYAYDQLKKADANVIGVVMNMCESEPSTYYYQSKDGKRVRKGEGTVSEAPEMPARRSADLDDAEVASAAVEPLEPKPAQTPTHQQHRTAAAAKPSETAQFTAAAMASRSAAQSPRPVRVHREGEQATKSRFSR